MPLHLDNRCRPSPSAIQHGIQFGERFEPALFAWARQVFREPLADLESRRSVVFVVELESELRLERLEALLQLTGYVHDAFEQFAVGDVGEVDVDVDTKVGFRCRDLDPPLIAAGTYVELDLVARQ